MTIRDEIGEQGGKREKMEERIVGTEVPDTKIRPRHDLLLGSFIHG